MIFKIKYEKLGDHIHCALFAAKQPNMTYATCGNFVVREGQEFEDLKLAMSGVMFQTRGRVTGDAPLLAEDVPQAHGISQVKRTL